MNAMMQIAGAVLLLLGFAATQIGLLKSSAPTHLVVNVVGAAVLAGVALSSHDWGFLLLEGSWAVISLVGLLRRPAEPNPGTRQWLPLLVHDPALRPQTRRPSRGWRKMLPPVRAARFAGDELSSAGRLVRLFRDSYAGAQGRQWLQPHILWWILKVLHRNNICPDWQVLDGPKLARSITALGLPAGHTGVHPAGQAGMNFGFWWPVVAELAAAEYRTSRRRRLPHPTQVHDRAWRLGLRPWMSSATVEEMAGIDRALAVIREHDRHGRLDPDELMVRFLLPELLIAELHWLHAAGGRPRRGNKRRVEVVLLSQYDAALSKWDQEQYLTPLEYLYLRAGDLLAHLSAQPEESLAPVLRPIVYLYRELRQTHAALVAAR